jgi:signal transduction histidine kinase
MTSEHSAVILYVDDEESNREIFSAVFDGEFKVVCVDGARAALEYLEHHNVAVIVSDQRMPGMQGHELMEQVRELWPATIRMLVTAYADLKIILRAVNDGLVVRYVVKPWDAEEMRELLHWGLEAHEIALVTPGEALQARLLESERLATLGAIQASFLHELGAPLSYITNSVSELSMIEEFRQPLTRLLARQGNDGVVDWGRLRDFLGDVPEIIENLRMGGNLLVHLRDDVRRLISPWQGSEDVSCSGQDVERAIRFALAVNRMEASAVRAKLLPRLSPQIPAVSISIENLMLILINLVRNAIQALSEDGAVNEVIVELGREDEETLLLSVSDTGKGMDEELTDKIGKQFVTTRPEGMGLGVFKARSLAEAAGGSLRYHSEPGVGTTAKLRLPVEPRPS